MIKGNMISIIDRRQWKPYVMIIGVLLIAAVAAISFSQVAHGYSGSSGGATGGAPRCGGIWKRDGRYHNTWPNSNCGTAWIKYPATAGASSAPAPGLPRGFKNGTAWSTVANTCSTAGSVIIFVYFSAAGTYGEPEESYDYTNGTGGTANVNYSYNQWAASGYAYKDLAGAQADFNSTPSNQRSGNTWGYDVGWYCYSDNPLWTTSVSTTVNRSIVEPGEQITWTHTVTNNGPNNTNKDITWHYQNRGDWPNTSGSDSTLPSGSAAGANNGSPQSTYVVQQSDLGKKICRATSASPASNTDPSWVESAPQCVTVGTRPKIHILGGDLLVGNTFNGVTGGGPANVQTSTSLKIEDPLNPSVKNMFGSWVEYGIFATGTVTGTGSGSAFAGAGLVNPTQCEYSNLTFVNATTSNPATSCSTSSTLGGYSTGNTITGIAADFPVTVGTTPAYNDALPNPQGLYTSNDHGSPVVSDPITIGARTIAKNEWVVINAPNSDVTITGDIKYDNSPLQSIYNIPQLVIIAKDIYIMPNVQQVDAWLIAQGTQAAGTGILDTCHISSDYATPLTAIICNAPLQVNGPVMSQKLWLRRTGGTDIAGTAAEVFNLRPDAYLWAYGRASVSGRVQTVYTQELPPRF